MSDSRQQSVKRIQRPVVPNTTLRTDAVSSRTVDNRAVQNNLIEARLNKRHFEQLKRLYPEAYAAGMTYQGLVNLDRSTTPISFKGKTFVGRNYQAPNRAEFKQDNRTSGERKRSEARAAQNAAKQKELEEIQQAVEIINHPDNPLGWIPGFRSVMDIGGSQRYSTLTGETITPFDLDAAMSLAGDLLTARFGFGPGGLRSYAGSYVGSVAGGMVGDRYFDSPNVGRLVGGVGGGIVSDATIGLSKQLNNYINRRNFRRAWNSSVKDTEFVNIPIEHVSENGITIGSALERGPEGFHFSPEGSSTTPAIQAATNEPFVRRGTWTYTNNTAPVKTTDVGYFGPGWNPTFDAQVNAGNTNFWYLNMFDGNAKGNISFIKTDPNSGIQLSKNIAYEPIIPIENTGITSAYANYLHDIKDFYGVGISGKIGNKNIIIETAPNGKIFISGSEIGSHQFSNQEKALKFLEKEHQNFIDTLSPAEKEMYIKQNNVVEYSDTAEPTKGSKQFETDIKQRTQDDIDTFYNSDEYNERFNNRVSDYLNSEFGINPTQSDLNTLKTQFNIILDDIQKNYQPGMFKGRPFGFNDSEKMQLGINTNLSYTNRELLNETLTHEFGHMIYGYPYYHQSDGSKFLVVNAANKDLIGNASEHLTEKGLRLTAEEQKYLTYDNELTQRIRPTIKEMIENGWTPEQAYEKSKTLNNSQIKDYFKKDYLIKLLGGLLVTFPILANNDKTN